MPVVAVHGNFASKRWFVPLCDRVPPGLRLIAPDLPGFGGSAHLAADPPTIRFFADAVERLMAALALQRPVLLGHSLGGAVVAELAARDAGRYRGLVFISSAPLEGFVTPSVHYPVLRMYRHERALLRSSLALLMLGRLPQDFEQIVDDAQGMHPSAFEGNARALAAWNVMDRIPMLGTLPALILGGMGDTLIPPREVERLASHFPRSTVKLYGDIGHCLPLEAPALLSQELVEFVSALETC